MDTSIGPIRDALAIDISATDFAPATLTLARGASRAIWVATAGNLVCRFVNSASDVTLVGLLAGQTYPFQISIVRKTSTTITGHLLY